MGRQAGALVASGLVGRVARGHGDFGEGGLWGIEKLGGHYLRRAGGRSWGWSGRDEIAAVVIIEVIGWRKM